MPARSKLKASRCTLVDALTGRITDRHRLMLRMHLRRIESLEQSVRELEARADSGPFRAATELLTTMPGISDITARVIVAEIGDDMSLPDRRAPDLLGGSLPASRRIGETSTILCEPFVAGERPLGASEVGPVTAMST